jgi:hypothetical protein
MRKSPLTVLEQILMRGDVFMEQRELMIAILRILLQKGTINEDVFNKSIKKITSNS